ncbi:hypothetical protein [Kitasatospora sp. NPDC056181]|uniref:hypothetical protein n=1 Tax=Kitasatospora sp. NPDC056181 TaxID=3345737 RepID=UPI0035DA3944
MHVYESTTNLADMIREAALSSGVKTEYKVEHMESHNYNASGQIGAFGEGASASNNTFNQIWSQHSQELNLEQLAADLGMLRAAMQKEARSADELISASDIAKAEIEATKGNGPASLEHLKSAGKWALDMAKNIGTEVAKLAISQAMSA